MSALADPIKREAAERDYWLQIVDRGFLLDWEEYLTDVHEIFGIDAPPAGAPSAAHAVQLLDLAHVPLGDVGFYALAQARLDQADDMARFIASLLNQFFVVVVLTAFLNTCHHL